MTLPARMTAIAIRAPGGPEMLVPEERPMPAPGPGEILVKVAAAGVNRPDVRQRQGTYPPPKGATDIPGLEIAGEVAALGPDVKRWKVGDKVCALVVGGGYAQYCLAYEPHALPVPPALSMVEAAAIPETFFTCWQNMFMRADGQQRRLGAGARRHLGHRHHRDHAGQGVRRQGHHHRGLGGKMRGGQEARRRCRGQLQDRGFRRADQGGDRRHGRQPDRRHRRRRLRRPQLRLRGRAGHHRAGVVHRRPQGHRQFRQPDAQAPASTPARRCARAPSRRRPRSRAASRTRSGRWSRPARSSR